MKKIILSIAIIATAAIAGWNYQQNQTNTELSDLALANIEALARGETYMPSGTCHGTGPNFSDVHCDGGYTICAWCHTNIYGKN